MARIHGIEGLARNQIELELQQGGRFVEYLYCISIGFMTFRRASDIYFIRKGRSSLWRGLEYSAILCLFGWWGIPWGPICTIACIRINLRGGKDMTQQVLAALGQRAGASAQAT